MLHGAEEGKQQQGQDVSDCQQEGAEDVILVLKAIRHGFLSLLRAFLAGSFFGILRIYKFPGPPQSNWNKYRS
ncbi:hypothetical protein D3C72_2236620 [compost metagenome]